MKKVKKLLALVMAMTMVLGMAISVSAAPSTETATATVKGIDEANATVEAYQLVYYDAEKQDYDVTDGAKLHGYTVGSREADVVAELAKNVGDLGDPVLLTNDGSGEYKASLTAGTYLIIVTGTGSTLYNPMLMSLEVKYPDGTEGGEVNADDWFVESSEVYAKSTGVTVDKIIVDEEGNQIGDNGKYDDVYAGTEVFFELSGTIPSYSEAYENVVYTLTDDLGTGLTIKEEDIEEVKANIENDLVERFGGDISSIANVNVTAQQIVITFNSSFILQQADEKNRDFTVMYSATVTGEASNFDPSTNTVKVTYTRNPGETVESTPVETNHYTFDLEDILYKVDAEDGRKLEGAEFELTAEDGKVFTATSDENGEILFTGLDEGTYTLKETKAPTGYSLPVDIEYTLRITAYYETNNTLDHFNVRVEQNDTFYTTIQYRLVDGGGGHPALSIVGNQGPDSVDIKNTKLASLPSTGGIGTTIFTIGGCAIMIAAAALYFVNRRKSEEN